MISVPLPQLNAALIEPPFPRAFTVLGYQTAEEARAYFAGQTAPFAKIERWLEEYLPGERSISAHDDFHGSLHVAIWTTRQGAAFRERVLGHELLDNGEGGLQLGDLCLGKLGHAGLRRCPAVVLYE